MQGPVPVDYAELLLQFEQLKAEYRHLIKCHWFPLQRLAAGVISSLYIYAGEKPGPQSPSFGGECDCQLPTAEPSVPVGPRNSPPTPDSLPELESLSSSEESSPISRGFRTYLVRGDLSGTEGDSSGQEAGGRPSLHVFSASPGLGSCTEAEDEDETLPPGSVGRVWSDADAGGFGGGVEVVGEPDGRARCVRMPLCYIDPVTGSVSFCRRSVHHPGHPFHSCPDSSCRH